MKRCSRCGFECDLEVVGEYFHTGKTYKDGYRSHCKSCRVEDSKQRYANNREIIAEYKKQYARTNREAIAEYKKQWYKSNRENTLERVKQWAKSNPDKRAAIANKYRTTKNGNGGSFTKAEIDLLFLWQNGRCAYCDCKITKRKMHRDHIQPVSDGGTSNIDNIALACQSCNNSKHNKPLWLWKSLDFALEFFDKRKQFTILLVTSKL